MATQRQYQIVGTPTEVRRVKPGPLVLALLAASTGLAGLILGAVWFVFSAPTSGGNRHTIPGCPTSPCDSGIRVFRFFGDHESRMIQRDLLKDSWQAEQVPPLQVISNHQVALYGDQEARGHNRMHSMLTLLLQSSIFVAGFLVGYVACAWRSRRSTQFATVAPRISMFGHPRRAF